MTIQQRLLAYLCLIHGVFLSIVFLFYLKNPMAIVAAEISLLLSLALGIYLVKKLSQASDFTRQFQDLLQDENYATRMRASSNRELNELVSLFNRMLESLYRERIRLGEQRGFLERLLEATPSAVIVFDFDGKISLTNSSAHKLLGCIPTSGQTLQDTPAADSSVLVAGLQSLEVGHSKVISDREARRFRCQRSQFVDRGFQREFLLIDEITEELASSEKSTYEKLVRVLAHEVNNTVAATGSVLESILFYREQLNTDDRADFCTAVAAVQRRNGNLGEFIERFTQVVKMPDPVLRPSNLLEIVDGVLYLYRQQCAERGIALECRVPDSLPLQMLDAQLVEQVLMNILKNAIEAIGVGAPGQPLPTANNPAYVKFFVSHETDTQRVHIAIVDSGKGLSSVPDGQLFTPFFTTKKGGQGIGLMFVREVLNRHAFAHRLATNAGGKTQFDIWIEQAA